MRKHIHALPYICRQHHNICVTASLYIHVCVMVCQHIHKQCLRVVSTHTQTMFAYWCVNTFTYVETCGNSVYCGNLNTTQTMFAYCCVSTYTYVETCGDCVEYHNMKLPHVSTYVNVLTHMVSVYCGNLHTTQTMR